MCVRGRQKIFRPLLYPTLGGVCKILKEGGGELMHQVAPTSFAKKREREREGGGMEKGRSGLPCKLFLKFVSLLDTSLVFVDVRLGSFETSVLKHFFFTVCGKPDLPRHHLASLLLLLLLLSDSDGMADGKSEEEGEKDVCAVGLKKTPINITEK